MVVSIYVLIRMQCSVIIGTSLMLKSAFWLDE